MHIRSGESDRFPVDGSFKTWFIVIWVGDEIETQEFSGARTERPALLRFIDEKIASGAKVKLLGVWPGQWRTDAFALDIGIFSARSRVFLGEKHSRQKQ